MARKPNGFMRIIGTDDVPESWHRATVQQLLDDGDLVLVQDGNHGGNYPKASEFADSGVPLITGADIEGDAIDLRGCKFLKPESAEKLRIGFAHEGDVLLTHKGTMGKTAIIPSLDTPYIILNPQLTLYRTSPTSRIDSRYLKYFFDSSIFQSFLNRISGISTISTLSLTVQKTLELCFPDLHDQRAIASILGALDDKIELNRRMNATLESLARAIFKSWFVDFDPVRNKAEFGDSELGKIPEGWETTPLYDTAQFVNGASFKSADFCDASDGLPVIKIAELKNGISAQTKFSERELNATQMIDTGDLLYSWSGSPDTSLAVFVWEHGQGLLNQHIFKVVCESDAQKHYVYYLLKYMRSTLVEIARNKQTTGLGHVTVADMKRLHVCKPPNDVLVTCDRTLGAIYDRCFANQRESLTLSALRDTLLPKLLSGELPVPASLTATEEALE